MEEIRENGCELKIFGGWRPITLEEALAMQATRIKRCPICHGRVRVHPTSVDGLVAHFEHFELHPGCYLGDGFDGNPRPHRRALK
jgi:hypothetical protein